MERSTRPKLIIKNASQTSKSSVSEKGPINVDDALAKLPRKVKSIERVEIPDDPELEKQKSPFERSTIAKSYDSGVRKSESAQPSKVRETPRQPSSKGISVAEILNQKDEVSRRDDRDETPAPRIFNTDVQRRELSKIASREPSRIQNLFGSLREKSRHFEQKTEQGGTTQVPSREPVPEIKSRIHLPPHQRQRQRHNLPPKNEFFKEPETGEPLVSRITSAIGRSSVLRPTRTEPGAEPGAEHRTESTRKDSSRKDSVARLREQLITEREELEAVKFRIEKEQEEFEQVRNEIAENLHKKNDELERRYEELREQQEKIKADAEKAQVRRKTIIADYDLKLKIDELEKFFGVVLPEDPEERIACYNALSVYRKRIGFRRVARRLFVFCMMVIEFVFAELLGIDITDFAEDQVKLLAEYDDLFDEISSRWFGSGTGLSPEMKICLMFGLNVLLFIVGKYATKGFGDLGGFAVNSGKGFVKDFVSYTFLAGEPKSEITGDTAIDAVIAGWKLKKKLSGQPEDTRQAKQAKGPKFTD